MPFSLCRGVNLTMKMWANENNHYLCCKRLENKILWILPLPVSLCDLVELTWNQSSKSRGHIHKFRPEDFKRFSRFQVFSLPQKYDFIVFPYQCMHFEHKLSFFATISCCFQGFFFIYLFISVFLFFTRNFHAWIKPCSARHLTAKSPFNCKHCMLRLYKGHLVAK